MAARPRRRKSSPVRCKTISARRSSARARSARARCRPSSTTARYFTPSGRSIQAKGITPDIKILQEVPNDLKAQIDVEGEASLRGHLKAEGNEESGSQPYVPPDEKDDRG